MNHHVTWIPAHPAYGSISMFRYWNLLAAKTTTTDPWQCKAILQPPPEWDFGRAGKFSRAWQRKIGYPLRVRTIAKPPLAHILDHSWAEMLDFIPKDIRTVVTVHDLIPLRDAGGLSTAEIARFRDRVSRLEKADAIIAVSEYTRNETIDLLAVDPARVHVVPNGVDVPTTFPEPRTPDESFRIGSVGSTLPRKNLAIFPPAIRAFRATATRSPRIIRAGSHMDTSLRSELISAAGDHGLDELGRVSDAQLEDFFASLDVLVVPSHFEGFGLPVLEAMARGIPVISARTSSLPEVGGDAALYFDPNDPEELAQRLHQAADPATAAALRNAGIARAAQFSWRKTLEGFFKIYDNLCA